MSFLNPRLLIAIAVSCTVLTDAHAQEKEYYGSIDPKARKVLIAQSKVQKVLKAEVKEEDDKNNLTDKIDYVKFLSEKCGFEYSRDANGIPVRPQVSCVYKAREKGDEFNGMSAKFDCTFTLQNKDGQVSEKTLKVKYDPKKQDGGGYKEVPQAVLGTGMARLLGFYTNTYCPVDLTCKDCPSDNPWANAKSTAPALKGNVVEFKNVVVAVKQKGYTVVDNKNVNSEKPQGFSFDELTHTYIAKIDKAVMAAQQAERDALTLWMNFVVSGDADHHNNKLLCVKSTKPATPQEKPSCELSAALINDYGNSFGYTNGDTKLKLKKFAVDALRSSSDGAETTGASGNAGASGHLMSKAGRNLFVQNAEAITDQQLSDILNLAQIEQTSDSNVQSWIAAIRKKIQKIKSVKMN
jgi:hypothetical protein